ncbi:MAG: hypothetical protein M1818_003539 [Claussenomyces sp. TS43310]|nr:MAG: hypothetical protein M1818_003539 [Claussenomyces sp. TS43310]
MASYLSGLDPPGRPEPGWKPPQRPGASVSSSSRIAQPTRSGRDHHGKTEISREMEAAQMRRDLDSISPSAPRPSSQRPPPSSKLSTTSRTSSNGRTNAASTSEDPMLQGKHSRNVLRRKPSTIARHVALTSLEPARGEIFPFTQSSSSLDRTPYSHGNVSFDEQTKAHDTVLAQAENWTPVIPELDRYRSVLDQRGLPNNRSTPNLPHKLSTHDLPVSTPLNSGVSSHTRYSGFSSNSGYSVSPATRFSESPGPGNYSRDTTPTSMSSQSPGIIAPSRMTPRMRQTSPAQTRPPLSRRRNGSMPGDIELTGLDEHGLPSLRESTTSSSSTSTVKESGKTEQMLKDKRKKKKRLTPPPPSPPPRKSSQKFRSTRSGVDAASPSKNSKQSARITVSPKTRETLGNQQTNVSGEMQSHRPPSRPSREGAPDLLNEIEASRTIIQSNLAGLQFSHERRRSSSANIEHSVNQVEASLKSRSPIQNPTRLPNMPLVRAATPAPAGLGIIPDLRSINTTQQPRQDSTSRTPSPSTSATRLRFGFFGRRTHTAPEFATIETKGKHGQKGPAAGTGHERYGRYAPRRRSSGTQGISDTSQINANSQETLIDQRADDSFLLERMSPVIIAGGGEIVENHNTSLDLTRPGSNQSTGLRRPSIESKDSTSHVSLRSGSSNAGSRTTMWPSGLPANPAANRNSTSVTSRRGPSSEISDNEAAREKPTIAVRRSMHRLQSANNENHGFPPSVETTYAPSSGSQDTSIMSDDTRHGSSQIESNNPSTAMTRKLTKKARSPRKWNFFQRSRAKSPKPSSQAPLPVVVAEYPEKSIAHYAILDSSEQEEEEENMNIEDILREAEVVESSKLPQNRSPLPPKGDIAGDDTAHILAPPELTTPAAEVAHSIFNSPAPRALFSSPEPMVQEAKSARIVTGKRQERTGRPSRLPQVGRIPRVITARPEQTSPKSFSRPFARISMIQNAPELTGVDQQSIALGPSPNRSPKLSSLTDALVEAPTVESELSSEQQRAFLVISPRKDSAATTSSSSGALSFAATTAIVPEADAALGEDEVWDEYNDLIITGEYKESPLSVIPSRGVPLQGGKGGIRLLEKGKMREEPLQSLGDHLKAQMKSQDEDHPQLLTLPSLNAYSADFTQRFKDALDAAPSPPTPLSVTDFISEYGERNNSPNPVSAMQNKDVEPLTMRPTHESQAQVIESATVGSDEGSRRSTQVSGHVRESPMAQVNLRVSSMTVSKWLTFGHVLFSPAREEILGLEAQPKHHSILVIDGLGNDDWSFYAAETYTSATFYNLSPTPSRTAVAAASSLPSPPNHRQVEYLSYLSKFPFPREFFSAVVVRFPIACSEAALRNLISESRRVLKASGYLELSILDLDMVNMGNRCRRAVRGLKVKIAGYDPTISLAPLSDTVLKLIGKRGFHDVKSCTVGVPVASSVTKAITTPQQEKELSLADMMRDKSQVGDEGITKMVAKVGRWWFERCYVSRINPDDATTGSIFADKSLLEECERWGTSFKLLVCYAQKPAVPHRRTFSI